MQNIVQWVKVDNLYVKNFFTNMRAVCTQAVHEKYKKMGGPRKKIEVSFNIIVLLQRLIFKRK